MKPLCFVLMPFNVKEDPQSKRLINFDAVYAEVIKPAIMDANMEPLRGDEEIAAGIIHKPMFEKLMLCDYAVADLTTANANVYYELGIRHAARPHSTILMFVDDTRLPFDVAPLRGLPYQLGPDGLPTDAAGDRAKLAAKLDACRDAREDSPLYQLIEDWPRPEIAHLKTDRFRELAVYSQEYKDRLTAARETGADAVRAVGKTLDPKKTEVGILIDLMLSYRAVKQWGEMIDLIKAMPEAVSRTVMVQEQLGMALNRAGRPNEAIDILRGVITEHGSSSETNGLLGRIYKDKWEASLEAGESMKARGFLKEAIKCYLDGYEADMHDTYPGINAVTLMEMSDPVDPRQAELLPVVRYAATRRAARVTPDYWDLATMLELAVLARDEDGAIDVLGDALAAVREIWEPETTARNLRLIAEVRSDRGEETGWVEEICAELARAAQGSGAT